MKVECIQQTDSILGEGPVWDWRNESFFWLDILAKKLFRLHLESGTQTGCWSFPSIIGCMALTENVDVLLVALSNGFHSLNTVTGELNFIYDPEPERPDYRFNDGGVDALGRLWVSTMSDESGNSQGNLYRYEGGNICQKMDTGFKVPNGISWSPDNKKMYLSDSQAYATYIYDFELQSGKISNRKVLIEYDKNNGVPDGLTVDSQGNIWSSIWDGWRIQQHAPDGSLLRTLKVPVERPTSIVFAGTALNELLITSASFGFSNTDLTRQPLAGRVFRIVSDTKGRSENIFRFK
jgi:sugar lactone lactonase YvrE